MAEGSLRKQEGSCWREVSMEGDGMQTRRGKIGNEDGQGKDVWRSKEWDAGISRAEGNKLKRV